jgi:hypothetical protein
MDLGIDVAHVALAVVVVVGAHPPKKQKANILN